MSDMKCPFCNGELVGTIGHPICRNQDCVMCDDPMPQELLELLDRTRKALELAIDTIIKASDALIGCQEADNKHISDITAEDGLELLSEELGKIRFLQKDE